MAPTGKAVVIVAFEASYEFWNNLSKNKVDYENEKKINIDDLSKYLDNIIENFSENIEVSDLATPMTWLRYTGNWKSSYEGWLIKTKTLRKTIPKTLPKLKNIYMISQ